MFYVLLGVSDMWYHHPTCSQATWFLQQKEISLRRGRRRPLDCWTAAGHIISYVKFIVPPLHYIRPWVHYVVRRGRSYSNVKSITK